MGACFTGLPSRLDISLRTSKVSPPILPYHGAIEIGLGWVLFPSEVLRPPFDSFLLQRGAKCLLRSFHEKLPPTTIILSPSSDICLHVALSFSGGSIDVVGLSLIHI